MARFEIDENQYLMMNQKKNFTPTEARKEYSRLRSIARKRLQRLQDAGYGETRIAQRYSSAFKPLPKDASEAAVRKKLAEVAHFLSLKTSTVSGKKEAQKREIAGLHAIGYTFINASNIDKWNDYMDRVMSYNKASIYGSDSVYDLFVDASEKGVDPMLLADDFDNYIDNGIPKWMIPEKKEKEQEVEKKPRNKRSAVEKQAAKNREKAQKLKQQRDRQNRKKGRK